LTVRRRPTLCRGAALLAAALALAALPAVADERWNLSASYRLVHDSNLFRLPDGADPRPLLGRNSRAETIDLYALSFDARLQHSLQRFELSAGLVEHRYRHFGHLNLRARNHDLAWHWALTPRLSGTLRSERDEDVNEFADAAAAPGAGNRRVRRHDALDAGWDAGGGWRLLAALRRQQDRSDRPLIGQDSQRSEQAEAGVRYDAGGGSIAQARLRQSGGRTGDERGALAVGRDPRFEQRDLVLDLRWPLTGKTLLDLTLTHLEREHAQLRFRDYDGFTARADLHWDASARTRAALRWASELASFQTDHASYSRSERLGLTLSWAATERLRLDASAAQTYRRSLGAPPGRLLDPRRDTTRELRLGLRWSIGRHFALDSAVERARREVNLPGQDHTSTRWSLGLSATL
jgi:exopolysaccharide biosynthesis operon protein EpsL